MFREISQQLYGYILNAEMIFLDMYKVNPWQIVGEMPLVDLQFYMKKIEESWKKKKDNFKKKDMMEALKHINDVLTWIFHKK
mgnify:CR=1 FL=1